MKILFAFVIAAACGSVGAQSCQVESINATAKLSRAYSGGCADGLANGRGEYSYTFFNDTTRQDVTITLRGQFVNGKLDGAATSESNNGYRFSGNWKQNKRHGPGKESGSTGGFEGEWNEGRTWNGIGSVVEGGNKVAAYRKVNGRQTVLCRPDGRGEDNCSAEERTALLGASAAPNAAPVQRSVPAPAVNRQAMAKPAPVGASQTPGEKAGEYILFKEVASKTEGSPFLIESFTKTNGQRAEVNGVKIYRLWYSAVVRYEAGVHPECANTKTGPMECILYMTQGKTMVRAPGHRERFEGVYEFQQTEKGWLGPGDVIF